MTDDEVARNLTGMDELDFNGWNKADWNGVFAQHHTDDVVAMAKGNRLPTASRSISMPLRPCWSPPAARSRRSRHTRSGSGPANGRA
jgi:hypothetical protein